MNKTTETWKDIKGYEGVYQASTHGRIKRLAGKGRLQERIVNQTSSNTGNYCQTQLSLNGKVKRVYVHRLIAQTFLDNSNELTDVMHIDGNRSNNCVSNLKWATRQETLINAHARGAYGDYSHLKENVAKAQDATRKVVNQYDKDGNFIATYSSTREAMRQTGIQQACISQAAIGKLKTAGGFTWKYEN